MTTAIRFVWGALDGGGSSLPSKWQREPGSRLGDRERDPVSITAASTILIVRVAICEENAIEEPMNEHDDDLEPEVAEDAEIETEKFPILDDEDVEPGDDDDRDDVDRDESEL